MDDKATAAKIVADAMNSVCETSMESAIVAALEAARREGYEKGRAVGVPWIGKPVEDAAMEGGKA
jgi:hypothetical protein